MTQLALDRRTSGMMPLRIRRASRITAACWLSHGCLPGHPPQSSSRPDYKARNDASVEPTDGPQTWGAASPGSSMQPFHMAILQYPFEACPWPLWKFTKPKSAHGEQNRSQHSTQACTYVSFLFVKVQRGKGQFGSIWINETRSQLFNVSWSSASSACWSNNQRGRLCFPYLRWRS